MTLPQAGVQAVHEHATDGGAMEPYDVLQGEVILKIDEVYKLFPGTVALKKVNVDVLKGEIHGIIGKNGAGKSTLVSIVAGLEAATGGTIYVRGKPLPRLTRAVAKRERIAIVPQEPQVIPDFTVAENLFLGSEIATSGFISWSSLHRRSRDILDQCGLPFDTHIKAADLSVSEQQLLLVAKACYVEQAEIIIFDEASASLTERDEETLHRIVFDRKQAGCTILYISHRIDELLKVCDRVTVLQDGQSSEAQSCELLGEEDLASLIVGENYTRNAADLDWSAISDGATGREVAIAIEGLGQAGVFEGINLTVYRGEVVGLAGLRGSGRTELLKAVAGVERADAGLVTVGGKSALFSSPSAAISKGVVYLPEDREHEGIIGTLSVRINCVLNALDQVSRYGFVRRSWESAKAAEVIRSLDIAVADMGQEVSQLSGGNKQKVLVGRIAASKPRVFLLDEPTRGVDVGTRDSIMRIVRYTLAQSAGVVITSPGLEDLLEICDRIAVMRRGRIVAEFSRDHFDEREIYLAMQGATESLPVEPSPGTSAPVSTSPTT